MRMLPPAARFIFQGDATARAKLAPVWGAPFSPVACRATTAGNRATLWLGPDEYLLFERARDSAFGISAARDALGDLPHSLVDISHRQVALEVSGRNAETILNGACPLDLSLEAFPVGMCTRTVFSKADIVLWRTAAETFHIEVWRSFAAYVVALLKEIAEAG